MTRCRLRLRRSDTLNIFHCRPSVPVRRANTREKSLFPSTHGHAAASGSFSSTTPLSPPVPARIHASSSSSPPRPPLPENPGRRSPPLPRKGLIPLVQACFDVEKEGAKEAGTARLLPRFQEASPLPPLTHNPIGLQINTLAIFFFPKHFFFCKPAT